jgi:IS5 family transposase
MKLHVGVDSKAKLVHSMTADAHDGSVLGRLLHGAETRVYGDQAYRGQREVIRAPRQSAHL